MGLRDTHSLGTDIKVHRQDLIVSTQGRAIWIVDNVSALHQLTPQVTPTGPTLFKARDGYCSKESIRGIHVVGGGSLNE